MTRSIIRYGPSSLLPETGYDVVAHGFDFSVYSPTEIKDNEHATWAILRDVVDGVGMTVVGEGRAKEVAFMIENGPSDIFIGYGHFVARRA